MNAALRALAWTLALSVVALPLVAVLNGWLMPEHWPIRQLDIAAEYQHISEDQIRDVVLQEMGAGYFDTDPVAIRQALASLPWAEKVEVSKYWPDRLDVVLFERQAVAHWGDDHLLNAAGEPFHAPDAAQQTQLPWLNGPDQQAGKVLAAYKTMRELLQPSGLMVERVHLSRRGSWRLQLDNGSRIVIGRSDQPAQQLPRLVRVLPHVLQGGRQFQHIDLRYTNGFAVTWANPDGNAEEPAG